MYTRDYKEDVPFDAEDTVLQMSHFYLVLFSEVSLRETWVLGRASVSVLVEVYSAV